MVDKKQQIISLLYAKWYQDILRGPFKIDRMQTRSSQH